jgi:hypothetical protein
MSFLVGFEMEIYAGPFVDWEWKPRHLETSKVLAAALESLPIQPAASVNEMGANLSSIVTLRQVNTLDDGAGDLQLRCQREL